MAKFHLFIHSLQNQVSLVRSYLFIFYFTSIALGDWPKKTLVRFMSENVLPMLSSNSFMVSFAVQNISLIRFHLSIFAFTFIALGDWPKKTLVWFMSENVLPMCSFRSFMVSSPVFKSSRYFQFIFVCGVRMCANFFDLHVAIQLSQYH